MLVQHLDGFRISARLTKEPCVDGSNLRVFGSFADQSAGHGEGFLRVSSLDSRSQPLHITFAGSDPGQQWIQIDVRQVDHPFGGGGGVGWWRVTQHFCGSGVEGMEPAGGLDVAQSRCQSLPDGRGLPPLHLDFTPDREVAKITWIGFPGPIGRFEGLLEFAFIQQYFGKIKILVCQI